MRKEQWKYIPDSDSCYISADGIVRQRKQVFEFYRKKGQIWIDVPMRTEVYDYETRQWTYQVTPFQLRALLLYTWFTSIPEGDVAFLDGDSSHCTAENICIIDAEQKIIRSSEREWGFVFDRRLRGRVQILETGEIFLGPSDAARAVGGTRSGVSRVLSGELQHHHGYSFRYI